MRLSLRFLGLDLLDVELSTDPSSPGPDDDDCERDLSGGTTASMPMGYTSSWGDQRWEKGPDLE